MSTEAKQEIGQLLTGHLTVVEDGLLHDVFFAFQAMRDERGAAQMCIANACTLVDKFLESGDCSCRHGFVCIWHQLDDALRGAS